MRTPIHYSYTPETLQAFIFNTIRAHGEYGLDRRKENGKPFRIKIEPRSRFLTYSMLRMEKGTRLTMKAGSNLGMIEEADAHEEIELFLNCLGKVISGEIEIPDYIAKTDVYKGAPSMVYLSDIVGAASGTYTIVRIILAVALVVLGAQLFFAFLLETHIFGYFAIFQNKKVQPNNLLNEKATFELVCCFRSAGALLKTKILRSAVPETFRYAAFTEILVNLSQILYCADTMLGSRINFTDDVKIKESADPRKRIADVTHLVKYFRNSACHSGSEFRYFGDKDDPRGQKSFFGHIIGKGISDIDPSCVSLHADDVAYFTGTDVIYVGRHIERAFSEALEVFRVYFPKHIMDFIEEKR